MKPWQWCSLHLDLVQVEWARARCTYAKLLLCFANTESLHTTLNNETRYPFVALEKTNFIHTHPVGELHTCRCWCNTHFNGQFPGHLVSRWRRLLSMRLLSKVKWNNATLPIQNFCLTTNFELSAMPKNLGVTYMHKRNSSCKCELSTMLLFCTLCPNTRTDRRTATFYCIIQPPTGRPTVSYRYGHKTKSLQLFISCLQSK